MTMGLKIACGLYGLLMTMLGGRWVFAFDGIAEEWMVQALGTQGMNNLVADMSALFLGTAIMIALGLRRGQSIWLLAAALLMAIAAAGRLYGFATVAYVPEVLVTLVIEVASAVLLFVTHKRLSAELAS